LHLFCVEKQGLAMRLGKKGGSVLALLRNQLTFMVESPGKRAFLSTIKVIIAIRNHHLFCIRLLCDLQEEVLS
jgi:hypothetical protein